MLGKLMKYEIKATARTFVPIYLALILVSVINRLFRAGNIDLGFGISTLLLVGLFIALGVLTLIMIVQRFNKNLLGDEGYLMFTLPVTSNQLIASKLIVSIFWTIISSIVAVTTFIILMGDIEFFRVFFSECGDLWAELSSIMQEEMALPSLGVCILLMFILSLLSYIGFIFQIYLSLAAAQLPVFNNHRGIIAFIVFFVINMVLPIVTSLGSYFIPVSWMNGFNPVMGMMLIYSLLICVVFYIGIKIILDKHLNLE